jgi:hypothetical protein
VVFVHQQPVVLSINQSQQFGQLVIGAYNLPAFVLLDVVGQFFFQFGREVSVQAKTSVIGTALVYYQFGGGYGNNVILAVIQCDACATAACPRFIKDTVVW